MTVEITDARDGNSQPCEVELFFDREALDSFVKRLLVLKSPGDHSHFMTSSWGVGDLSESKVLKKSVIAHHLRVTMLE